MHAHKPATLTRRPDARRLAAALLLAASATACEGIPTIWFSHDAGIPDAGVPVCQSQSIISTLNTPNLYFVLDHSGSMADYNKWGTMQAVVSRVITELGSNARFGATVFPPLDGDCGPGIEVLPLQLGDFTGTLAAQLLAATSAAPSGGTPTAVTLMSVLPRVSLFHGPTFVILATDGGANCDSNITCSLDQCTLNLDGQQPQCQPFVPPNCCDSPIGGPTDCLDTQATVAAVAALKAANISTFVIGIEGSAPYEQMLDQLAQVGGTARASEPYYYRVDSTDESALEATLAQVAAKIAASCTVALSFAPANPATVVVQEGGQPVPEDATNGWTITGSTLMLHGTFCDELLSGQALGLVVTDECGG